MSALRPPLRFWVRWSARDLRHRWVQVAAVAFIVALGTGTYSGLSSTSQWRYRSYDASFAALDFHDLRISFSEGTYVDAAALEAAVRDIPSHGDLEAVAPRLVVPTQVDASTGGKTVLVPGRIIGAPITDGRDRVDGSKVVEGRGLEVSDTARPVANLEYHFAKRHDLPADMEIEVSGGRTLDVVGQALHPEYFFVIGERGNLLAETNFAVLFTSLEEAQTLAERPGAANDLVMTLRPGADHKAITGELRDTLERAFPGAGFDVQNRRDDDQYRILYDDIEGDQRFYNIFSILILGGAAFAAFNLTGRIVEAQRREIGIGMALGTSPGKLAIRPVLVGLEVVLLGVIFGVVVGSVIMALLRAVTADIYPLPIWDTPFLPAVFLRGAMLGIALPMIAVVWPVWRAVRVPPVEAIHTGAYAVKGGGLAWLASRLPGRSTAQMPVRDVLRAPRRTAMTALGIAAAITVLIGVIGMIDSFNETISGVERELARGPTDRVSVALDSFYPANAPAIAAIEDNDVVAESETHLALGGRVSHGGERIDVLLDMLPLGGGIWPPTLLDDRGPGEGPSIVLTETAAAALGVGTGDTVTLRHPLRQGVASYKWVETEVVVRALSPLPTRFSTFMDPSDAPLMDLEGVTNQITVVPAEGVSVDEVKRALFTLPGVASVQPVTAYTATIRSEIGRVGNLFVIIEGAVLLLALLIAFNSASINADERRREHATMFAFGLRVRSVLRMVVVESLLVGVLGTLGGLLLGWVLLGWITRVLLLDTFPDLAIQRAVSGETLLIAVALGVIAVGIAPCFTLRRLRNMDVPSTLRVME